MPWPTPQDYNEAIQNPKVSFGDPDLQAGTPQLTPLGLPRPITGNFASVYRIKSGGQDWAVRCFFREYADIAERYRSISAHLSASRLPYTVPFQYLEQGIRVRGIWYPVLKMQWIEGELLHTFIGRNLGQPDALDRLGAQWLRMIGALEKAGIAHGDLQHGNVLVTPGGLRLVDYDGMFVPALAGRGSHEIGHPNYQHPARTGRHFSPTVDRFSATVIYLSVLGLRHDPALWDTANGGDECLILRKSDFQSPDRSDVWQELKRLPDSRLARLTETLETSITSDPIALPPLAETTPPTRRQAASRTAQPAPATRPPPAWVLEALPRPQPASFRSVPRARAVVGAATSLCALVLLATVVLRSAYFGGIATSLLGFDAFLVWLSFLADEGVVDRRRHRRQARHAHRQLRRIARELDTIDRRRERLSEEQRVRASTREAGLARIRAEESADVELVQGLIGRRIARYEAAIEEIDRLEQRTLAEILTQMEERRMRRALRKHHLPLARIQGVPLFVRCVLWARGIRSAADVTKRPLALQSLPPGQAADLLRWFIDVRARSQSAGPTSVPPHRAWPIRAEAARRRRRLQRRRLRAETQQDRLVAAARAYYDHRGRALRSADARAEEAGQKALELLGATELALIDEEPVWNRRLVDAQRELERFDRVRFDRFLTALVRGQ